MEDETEKTKSDNKEVKKEEPTADIKPPSTMVTEARKENDRMEKANAKREELLLREEQLQAEKTLGGETDAGSKTMTEDEKTTEGAKKLLAGTGYEDMLDE